jgi:CRISPR/Cas system CMR-associated protein Cmr5 small subunit
MLKNGYRDKIDNLDLGQEQNSVGSIINKIENDVIEIRDELAKYKNLTEIYEIYEMADYLCKQLY